MKSIRLCALCILNSAVFLLLSACASLNSANNLTPLPDGEEAEEATPDYSLRLPQTINSTGKVVVVDPRLHVWGAYDNGQLIRAGIASAGADWCGDLGRPCHTRVGTFRVYTMSDETCKSTKFPIPMGGAPMPYCMYFSGGQALHGVPRHEVGEGNYSHGCVRLRVADAEWLRYNFVTIGTKVIVKPY